MQVWNLVPNGEKKKKKGDSSVKGAAGKMLNARAGGSSDGWEEGVLGTQLRLRSLWNLPSWNLFPSLSLVIKCQVLHWSCTFRYKGRLGEFLLLPEVTSFQPPLSWELSPLLIQAQFPAVPPSLHHWFLARLKTMSLSCLSFLMLQSTYILL